jgi:hypothetical protein
MTQKKPLVVEKTPIAMTPRTGITRELNLLYQRRAVVLNLIQSLEVYERCHGVTSLDSGKRKSA